MSLTNNFSRLSPLSVHQVDLCLEEGLHFGRIVASQKERHVLIAGVHHLIRQQCQVKLQQRFFLFASLLRPITTDHQRRWRKDGGNQQWRGSSTSFPFRRKELTERLNCPLVRQRGRRNGQTVEGAV